MNRTVRRGMALGIGAYIGVALFRLLTLIAGFGLLIALGLAIAGHYWLALLCAVVVVGLYQLIADALMGRR